MRNQNGDRERGERDKKEKIILSLFFLDACTYILAFVCCAVAAVVAAAAAESASGQIL